LFYSDELIEEIRQASDIVSVIGSYVKLTKKGNRLFGLCPFHNEKTGSFSVDPNNQLYYCFGCHAGGNVFTFVMEYENYSFQEAVEFLANRAGISLPTKEESGSRQENDRRKTLLEINKLAARYYYYCLKSENGKRAYQYLTERGLTDKTIQDFGLGYSTARPDDLYRFLKSKGYNDEILSRSGLVKVEERYAGDRFWNRVMFPIMDVNSKVIGFGGRVMGNGEPKYLNSPETMLFDKSRNLYGLHRARRSRASYFLICEGYMDVIAMHQAGFTNSVASLGTAFTSQHATLLRRYVSQVILTYDSDGAGVNAALRAIPLLKQAGMDVKVLSLKPYKDPDEFIKAEGAEAFEERIKQAKNSFLFEIEVLQKDYDFTDPAGQTHFQRKVAEKLLEFSEELERENYLQAVATQFGMNVESLRRLVADLGSKLSYEEIHKPEKMVNIRQERKKESGIEKAQRLLLSYLIMIPDCFGAVSPYIKPSDFSNEKYRQAAQMVYEKMSANGQMQPAQLLNHFINDEQDYKQISMIFNTELGGMEDKKEQEKILTDLVRKIKQNSLENAGRQVSTIASLQEILKAQTELKKLYIYLN
jgi:DNA primase